MNLISSGTLHCGAVTLFSGPFNLNLTELAMVGRLMDLEARESAVLRWGKKRPAFADDVLFRLNRLQAADEYGVSLSTVDSWRRTLQSGKIPRRLRLLAQA